ncbi:hypothetical protein AcidC75_25430 [Acidisoma sp. C75]
MSIAARSACDQKREGRSRPTALPDHRFRLARWAALLARRCERGLQSGAFRLRSACPKICDLFLSLCFDLLVPISRHIAVVRHGVVPALAVVALSGNSAELPADAIEAAKPLAKMTFLAGQASGQKLSSIICSKDQGHSGGKVAFGNAVSA